MNRRKLINLIFDHVFYIRSNPDVERAAIDPLDHYLKHGVKEGRDPHPLFDVNWFVEQNPGAADDPVIHYLNGTGSKPHPLFDGTWYLDCYPDVRADGLHPFVHYLTYGQKENRNPHPLFDASWYVGRYPDANGAALVHYLNGLGDGPHPLFDDAFYVESCGSSAPTHHPALVDYLLSVSRWTSARPHPLFDGTWYLDCYPDVRADGLHPFVHYLTYGQKENRNPHPLFDASWYVGRYPDANGAALVHYLNGLGDGPHPLFDDAFYVESRGSSAPTYHPALVDYLLSGAFASDPNALFNTRWYVTQAKIFSGAAMTPLEHYCREGERAGYSSHPVIDLAYYGAQLTGGSPYTTLLADLLQDGDQAGRSPSRLFDVQWYRTRAGVTYSPNTPAFQHYLRTGWRQGHSPHPLFDVQFYLASSPDVAEAAVEPLTHYLADGYRERRRPHPLFDIEYYLRSYPDVVEAGSEPVQHYMIYGDFENRNPNPVFDTRWYRQQHEARLGGQNALVHYVTIGATEGRDPSPLFSCEYYLAQYPDVRKSGLNPLHHFLLAGQAEGRSPRPPDRLTDVCGALDIPYEIWRAPPELTDRDVCLFMAYTADGELSPHVLIQLEAWQEEGYLVILILATDGLIRPLPQDLDTCAGILLRTNHGWDFAAWATAMAVFPEVWRARSLVLVNDSVYGPVDREAFRAVIDVMRTSRADIVALTDSYQTQHHFMSYFTGLTRSGLRSTAVRRHWASVQSIRDKREVINRYEITPISQWHQAGVVVEVLFPTADDVDPPINPTLIRWRELVSRGFPFIKVQLLRDLLPGTDTTGWREIFVREPKLLLAVEAHLGIVAQPIDPAKLEERRIPQSRGFRPIPAPKRRFKRNLAPKTFYGATQSARLHEATDLALEVPFSACAHIAPVNPIAIIAHIFYPEATEDLLKRFSNIPGTADLFVTTDSSAKKAAIARQLAGYKSGSVEIRVVPNVGRDIAAMFVGCRDVFERYEIFLHVHSKKSPHDERFSGWRDFLLENLLGSPEIAASNLSLISQSDVGVVFSEHFNEVRALLNWGYDFDLAKGLLAKAGIEIRKDLILDFPSSSFFWAKTAAVRPLLDLGLDWSSFPPEAGQVDGTLAHAIERSLLFVAESAGFRWVKVSTAGHSRDEALLPVFGADGIERSLRRAFRPLLGNPLSSLVEKQTFPEIVPITTRADPDRRPRLNLVIPTLHPKHIFGGITTALKIFHELADQLGEAFDRRLICTSYAVDLEAMIGQPDYKLVPLGSAFDDLPRSIVDMTDRESGELPVRSNDVFVTTAWWTDVVGSEVQAAQKRFHGRQLPIIYLIQDHEPNFYAWSSHYALSRATYAKRNDLIALINSEELANFMQRNYNLSDPRVVRYSANPKIIRALKNVPRERIILIYGRPSVARNCFETLCAGLRRWQQADPISADSWRIVSAGEDFDPADAGGVVNLEVCGKLSLDEYGDLLSRALIGVSLMLSPHPSYPPLEMAAAGLYTITNAYDCKDLSVRNSNIVSLADLTPDGVAAALEQAVLETESRVGGSVAFGEISTVSCDAPTYTASVLAHQLTELVVPASAKREGSD
ncbi:MULTISPECIES: rhamnosyltransferase WsaF family glycosyltransferase [Methylobacterium]|uniref:rhamnosyltransferase WsaF family glycosyltransferase n=1 Tax=Methylobacterium TaxID=407 RepID=UPI001AE10AA7|nr:MULTISPECIES: rhamnan synthesis F family protein [unclassified Methylobacterium]MBP2499944.1 lipopolysaccharide biosynthesis protein [Methylobacterium sp. PvP109]